MKRLFNGGWSFWCGEPDLDVSEAGKHLTEFQKVDLPHDWLIADAKNLYRDGCGFYRKIFSMQPKENKRYSLIFEGVYMDTTIWVNEQQAGEWKYGYSTFEIDLTPFVKAGENEILVSVNFRSPNSRWYSGTGIYRPVWLYTVPKNHLRFDSVKITTLDYKEPKIRVEAWPNAAGEVKVEILEKQMVTRKAVAGESADQTDETIELCIDENAVQPTVQNSDKASGKIIALEILQADGKFSREIALRG